MQLKVFTDKNTFEYNLSNDYTFKVNGDNEHIEPDKWDLILEICADALATTVDVKKTLYNIYLDARFDTIQRVQLFNNDPLLEQPRLLVDTEELQCSCKNMVFTEEYNSMNYHDGAEPQTDVFHINYLLILNKGE